MSKKIKVLNLYCGIGGNRKLWDNVEVTAVEINPEIAKIYKDFFSNDNVIVGDAHKYLLEHFSEFDFIWSSPPCPSHSRIRLYSSYNKGDCEAVYPDMKLYEEIILLQYYFKGLWVVENVISYYEPLIKPKKIQRHYFWSNYPLTNHSFIEEDYISEGNNEDRQESLGFDISNYSIEEKTKILRNCVNPELGLHIFEMAFKKKQGVLAI